MRVRVTRRIVFSYEAPVESYRDYTEDDQDGVQMTNKQIIEHEHSLEWGDIIEALQISEDEPTKHVSVRIYDERNVDGGTSLGEGQGDGEDAEGEG